MVEIEKMIDFRSDTLTQPTAAMRKAMAAAHVGDDVFGEDPTLNELQSRVANLLQKDAALFVPSGTMSNQIAIKTHTQPGDEVICDANCHILNYEGGGPAMLSGVQLQPLHGERGAITAEQIRPFIRQPNVHFPRTRLIEIENTHNRGGGSIFPLAEMQAIYHLAQEHGLAVHLDGARLWNAHVATGIPLQEYAACADSISLCFSKGLGAPVGSILVGDAEFIERAHRYRKVFGGGMRQAGILAAAALHALDHHIERLQDDHARAHRLAESLASLGITVDLEATQTNIVIADFKTMEITAESVTRDLAEHGVLALPVSATRVRFVTHLDLSEAEIDKTITILRTLFS